MNKLTEQQVKSIFEEYYNSYLTQSEIAKKYNVTQAAITWWRKKLNLEVKPTITKDFRILEKVNSLYKEGKEQQEIAKLININPHTVHQILIENNITLRSKGGYKGYRKYTLNENYFEVIDSHEKAYILGLIYTDGNVYDATLQLFLKSTDVELIQKVKESLDFSGPIGEDIDYRKDPPTIKKGIRPASIKLTQDLIKLGVYPNKTLIIKWPEMFLDKFTPSFVLGAMDGDGGWWGESYPTWGIVSASENFLIGMKSYLNNKLRLGDVSIRKEENYQKGQPRKNPIYGLRYSGWKNCQLLYDFLYKDSPIWLERKRNKIETILASRIIKKLGRPKGSKNKTV